MKIAFLEANRPLTKSFKIQNGKLTKSSYPHVHDFTSHEENIQTIQNLYDQIVKHAAQGHCLLKGKLNRKLDSESRAGSTSAADMTEWICLDLDRVEGYKTTTEFLKALNLHTISHVVQYSASMGIDPNAKLSAHIFMLLNKETTPAQLKSWLKWLNLTTPNLKEKLTLTKMNNALHYPLDITTCQNDKLLFITPPILYSGLKDTLKNKRIKLVKGPLKYLTLPADLPSPAFIDADIRTHLHTLRKLKKLTKYTPLVKYTGDIEYLANPEEASITGQKTDRGFVYLNLNGGDSWGYYHPEDNADFIYNFKGEPVYLTKKLLPQYWAAFNAAAKPPASPAPPPVTTLKQGINYLAFTAQPMSQYYRGTYDTTTDKLDITPARTEKQLKDFMKAHAMPIGDYIPEWLLTFDPTSPTRIDTTNRVINLFEASDYMRATTPIKKKPRIPKTIDKIITSAIGGDHAVYKHFLNWLAFIIQKRERTGTAWVLHGVPGTGKGLLFHNILTPLIGENQVAIRLMDELESQFNLFAYRKLLVFIDEVQLSALYKEKGTIAKMKSMITEERISVRAMYQNAFHATNYSNWILASNMPDPIQLSPNDRRFNVARYQTQKLQITHKEINSIPAELQDFYDYLNAWQIDYTAVHTPIQTVDRENLISISQSSTDVVADAILHGKFDFFIDQLPDTLMGQSAFKFEKLEDYKKVLTVLIDRTEQNGDCKISRDELRIIFDYCSGNIPDTPNKFTSMLKHHRIHTGKIRLGDTAVYGIKTTWKDTKEFATWRAQLAGSAKLKAVK